MRYNLINFNHYVTQFDRHHQYINTYVLIPIPLHIRIYSANLSCESSNNKKIRIYVFVTVQFFARLIAVNNALLCVIRLNK